MNRAKTDLPNTGADKFKRQLESVNRSTLAPTLSIVMATFNADKTLRRALSSIAAQTIDYELIVVDGGSTDNTLAILASCQNAPPITTLISEPDRGLYDALNKGLRVARGEFIYIMGSDDELHLPDALNNLVAGAKETEDADVIYGRALIRRVAHHQHADLEPLSVHPLPRFKYLMPLSHQATIVRRTLFGDPAFGLSLASDYRFLFNLYLQNKRFCFVDTTVAIYAMGGVSDIYEFAATLDRLKINWDLRGWQALDILPLYSLFLIKSGLRKLLNRINH